MRAVNGIAPHQGGEEEEAVICVSEYDGKVQAAILAEERPIWKTGLTLPKGAAT